jgi:hypothetical protein
MKEIAKSCTKLEYVGVHREDAYQVLAFCAYQLTIPESPLHLHEHEEIQ